MVILPATLEGDNLGKRHHHLNRLVNESYRQNIDFKLIQHGKEESDSARFYKIDLANKCRNVDYIIENLKSQDTIYISRALKATWLITDSQYSNIINPIYLEETLFPQMLVTAAKKMVNRIRTHLKDENRCQHFFEYYKERENDNMALHFFLKCSESYIIQNMEKIQKKLNPHYLKILSEKTPKAAEIYFSRLIKNRESILAYFQNHEKFVLSVKSVLKANPVIYLDIIENHYDRRFKRLSANATEFIMLNHKQRFLSKPELYCAWLLDLGVVARCLSNEELKELLTKLAVAKYIDYWFSYKSVEPLLKRINVEKKAFVKSIFVQKTFGPIVEEAPYAFPEPPTLPEDMRKFLPKRKIMKKKGRGNYAIAQARSEMDEIYDKYRFVNFSDTFFELKKRIQMESSHSMRQMMLTVLITKSKSSQDDMGKLLKYFLEQHINEPITLKCSFARTLVTQAKAYNFNADNWKMFEVILHNIGVLSGTITEDTPYNLCVEAIIIHCALSNEQIPEPIMLKFMSDFSPLNQYELKASEKQKLSMFLYSHLINVIKNNLLEKDSTNADKEIWKMFTLLKAWKRLPQDFSEVITGIKDLILLDPEGSQSILRHLYGLKCCRKLFFIENFQLRQNQESYMNALKHDISLLQETDQFSKLFTNGVIKHEKFLRKLTMYFNGDLAPHYLNVVEAYLSKESDEKNKLKCARSFCILKGPEIVPFIKIQVSSDTKDTTAKYNLFNRHLIWNMNVIRPKISTTELLKFGANAVLSISNSFYQLHSAACKPYINELLEGPTPIVQLAVRLTFDKLNVNDIVSTTQRVYESIKTPEVRKLLLVRTFKYICQNGDKFPIELWKILEGLILSLKNISDNQLLNMLSEIKKVPDSIKVEYCTVVYKYVKESWDAKKSRDYHKDPMKPLLFFISKSLPKFGDTFLCDILRDFLEKEFPAALKAYAQQIYNYRAIEMIELIPKYLLFCKTTEEQDRKYEKIGRPFTNALLGLWNVVSEGQEYYSRELFLNFINNLNHREDIFPDITYVSRITIFEKVLNQIQEILPVEENFKLYAIIHLSMVFCKARSQCIKQHENLPGDSWKNDDEVISLIGHNFGAYIAKELEALVKRYSWLVRELYHSALAHYVSTYFPFSRQEEIFILSTVRGLLDHEVDSNSALLALNLYTAGRLRNEGEDYVVITKRFQEHKSFEVQFHVNNL